MPGGWEHSTGHDRTSTTAWKRTRKRILARDGYRCTTPGCTAPATDVDHLVPVYAGGDDADSNLTSICTPHHRAKTSREGTAARKAMGGQKRPTENHPGLL
jgi:5-methylcytosine-specific restriction enzyme A